MTEILNNINHLKTYLSDLEIQANNLINNRVKSSAPKAREIAQKMKIILQELRKDIQKSALEVPVKKRVKKVEPAKAVVEEVSAVVEEVSAVVEAVIEPEPPIEQTVEPPKSAKKRRAPVSKKSK